MVESVVRLLCFLAGLVALDKAVVKVIGGATNNVGKGRIEDLPSVSSVALITYFRKRFSIRSDTRSN